MFGRVQEFHNFSSSHPLRGERGGRALTRGTAAAAAAAAGADCTGCATAPLRVLLGFTE